MKIPILVPLLAAGFALLGCSDPPTGPDRAEIKRDDGQAGAVSLAYAANAAVMTPISFVTTDNGQGCAIPGYEDGFRANGESGRAKTQFSISFDVTGDLQGSSCVYIDANLMSPTGPQDFFTIVGYSINAGCFPSRGICGVWESRLPGKVDPSRGVVSRNHGVMVGIDGDAVGTRILLESFVECDPPGAGCAEGFLLEPGGF